MEILTNELTGKSEELLRTEILYFIASARAADRELLCLNIKKMYDERTERARLNAVVKILKTIKREGSVKLFVSRTDFQDRTTEAEYLENKYPELSQIDNENIDYLIKI